LDVEAGVAYVRGAVAKDAAAAIEDRVWEAFGARGVQRADPFTWPNGWRGLQVKLQHLRKSGMFAPFGNDAVASAISAALGNDWHELDPWGGPLISFPTEGPWKLPPYGWHSDLPARGGVERPSALRLFGFVSDVGPQGGGTLVIEGSHELIRRMVAESPGLDAGKSAIVKKELRRRYPWFNAPAMEPTEIDGVRVCVRELTGVAGDVAFMLPWTLHNVSMNCAATPRFMVTHTVYSGARSVGVAAEMASDVDSL
jgi:hypothetical protein